MTAGAGRAGPGTRPGPHPSYAGPDALRRALAAPRPTAGLDRHPAHTPGPARTSRPVTTPGPDPTCRATPEPDRAGSGPEVAGSRARATLTSEFRLVDGLRTHTRRSAEPTAPGAPPVVLVHGLAVSHRYLTPLVETLGTSHPVYVPDLPGFGLSAHPGHSYDLRQHVAHLLAWLNAYRMPPVCLVGHSFGAEVAAALAVARPGAVRALVLAGPTSDPTARSRRGLVGRWLVDTLREAPWQAPILVRDVLDAYPWRVAATVAHSVRNAVEEDLVRITVPTLVLAGERDPIVPPRWRAQVTRLVPEARLVTVPGAAHNVLTTAPGPAAGAIRDLLSRP
ncbi:alpha/beta fold hydrolase [Micromonospora sp. HUAS LYJ1]|uniref:alpha/beta fold hydrolase n=1 Tax=Micromonospora sp. HUAS LYJ1 TaxID=3061626 RepID=UPI002672C77B|nr:alpha/beta hydrolase [Micromonospora sp. HUAS LYJ1]WKU04921.1 alpha/beta hydrolase [Micromonospora sp. HUAS LYJ1]